MVKKEKTRSSKVPLIIIGSLIGFFALIWIISMIVNSNQPINNYQTNSSNSDSSYSVNPSCRDVQTPYDYVEEYQESEPYTDQECESKTLVYSITNFVFISSTCNNQLEECTNYFLGICTDKIVYCTDRTLVCSVDINNLDDERGSWTIKFNFYKQSDNSVGATDSPSTWLYPHTTETITGTGRITTKELYDTPYSCSYSAVNEPTKQVCRDVIKYHDVTKTRTVTRYKTEQQCN